MPALVVNLFLCLDCHRGIIPWDFRMLTTARSLPYLCTSLLCLEQVNSAPSLLSELPPQPELPSLQRGAAQHKPSRGKPSQAGCNEAFQPPSPSPQSQMQHEQSEQSLPLPSGARGGCSALPGYTEHLPTAIPNNSPAMGGECDLAVHQLSEMGEILSPCSCRKSGYDPNSPFWLQSL